MGGMDSGPSGGATSSVPLSITTLLKNMMGGGIFSIPIGLYLATPYTGLLLLVFCGALNAVTYWMVGYCCLAWGVGSFRELWNHALGEKTAWIIDVTLFINGWFTLVTYLVLIGDFTTKSCGGLLSPDHFLATGRNLNQWTITFALLIPLSLQRDLSKLAFTSILGLLILGYSYFIVVSDSVANAPAEISDGIVLGEWNMGAFEAIAIYTHAFVAHYNAPKLFSELENATAARWATVVVCTYTLAFLIYASFAWMGFRRFEGAVEGNILRNYPQSVKVLVAWLGMGFAMAFTYPIIFNAMRQAFVNLWDRLVKMSAPAASWNRQFTPGGTPIPRSASMSNILGPSPEVGVPSFASGNPATVMLVLLTAIVASFTSDLGIVNALSGSMLGCLVAFVFPSLLFFSTTKLQLQAKGGLSQSLLGKTSSAPRVKPGSSHNMLRFSMVLGAIGAICGIAFAVIGTVQILTRSSGGGH